MINAVGILQVHDELTVDPAHLPRVMRSLRRVCRHVFAYDDGSTDGSKEWLRDQVDVLVESPTNDWHRELEHKARLLDEVRRAGYRPDWLVWLDADEEFSPAAVRAIHELDGEWRAQGVTGVRLHEVNLWRDRLHHRLDMSHNQGWFMRLWRWHPELRYAAAEHGLHRTQFPTGVDARDLRLQVPDAKVLHYSWDSPSKITAKLARYARAGDHHSLPRMTDGDHVELANVPDSWRWVASEEEGAPRPWSAPFLGPAQEAALVERLREHVSPVRFLELGGGASTKRWAHVLRPQDELVTWEPTDSPWSGVVDAALAQRREAGGLARRLSSVEELRQALSGELGPWSHVLIDHELPGAPGVDCRDAAMRSLWSARAVALWPGATVALHDAQDHRERAGFVTLSEAADPNWVAAPTSTLWIGRLP